MPKRKSKLRSGAGGATVMPTEASIMEACKRGYLPQLQRWGRQGVRVRTWQLLRAAIVSGQLEVLRFLVHELGADVDQAMQR
jgi:hypothetical protein